MLTGHASHQVGLDADIWLTPMPDRELTREEREEMSATNVVAEERKDVDPEMWTPAHLKVIRPAAQDPQVERIFVNAAIKKALCREAGGDRAWLQQSAAVLGPRLSFPHSHPLPGRQPGMHAAAAAAGRGRLRQGARLVVHPSDPAPQAVAGAAEAAARAEDGGLADACGGCCWRHRPELDRGSLLAPPRHKYLWLFRTNRSNLAR